MFRVVALMVMFAHLGVTAAPYCETEFEPGRLPMLAVTGMIDSHAAHHASAPPVDKATRPAGHAHHHGHGSSHAAAPERAEIEAVAPAPVVRSVLRAVCLCGCSKNTNSPGTTTSPRLGFALFPPSPPRLVEAEPAVDRQRETPVPATLADALDHVPIFFS